MRSRYSLVQLAGESRERFHPAIRALRTLGELALSDRAAHLLAQGTHQREFILSVRMFPLVVYVDDADQVSVGDQRDRQEGFVRVLLQFLKAFEAGIGGGVRPERDHALVLRDPPGDAFAHL